MATFDRMLLEPTEPFVPVMHTKGNNWYVDFYAHDPVSGAMKRKKYMLNKYKTDQKKRMMGSLLIHNITAKAIGVSTTALSDILHGRRAINFDVARNIYHNLGVPANVVLG